MVLVTHSVAAAKRADRVLTLTATGLIAYNDAIEPHLSAARHASSA